MTTTKKITLTMLALVTLLLIAWDVYVAFNETRGDTISECFLWLSAHPALPFAFGILAGHLAWPQYLRKGE